MCPPVSAMPYPWTNIGLIGIPNFRRFENSLNCVTNSGGKASAPPPHTWIEVRSCRSAPAFSNILNMAGIPAKKVARYFSILARTSAGSNRLRKNMGIAMDMRIRRF